MRGRRQDGRVQRPRSPDEAIETRLGAQLLIEALIPGGEGLARAEDGRAVFVPGGLPGDRVRPLRARVKKSWARLSEWELLQAGPDRRAPPCPLASSCGGCDWMALPEAEQRRWKARLVQDAFRRTARVGEPPVEPPLPTAPLAYRSRLRLHIDRDGRIGLHAPGSRTIVPLSTCPVATEEVDRGLAALSRESERAPAALSAFDGVELRSTGDAPRLVLVLRPRRGASPPPETEQLLQRLGGVGEVTMYGADRPLQRRPLPGGETLLFGPSTFTQVHEEASHQLLSAVLEAAGPGPGTLLELYAGAGLFTLPLLGAGWDVRAVESSASAVADGRQAARALGLPDPFVAGDAAQAVRDAALGGRRVDLVLLDPPRAGAPEVVAALPDLDPRRVLMVACDPVTAARDARVLLDAGWRLERIRTFDLFPQTHHVEVLVEFAR